MDHPLLSSTQIGLRRRMVHFLKTALAVQRTSNIIFLCGGNEPDHMRICFREYCAQHLHDYEIFLPEFAMESIFSDNLQKQFDLADFEELVGSISHAIVLFPEAAGSYAETGYFAATPKLAEKCILVMNSAWQKQDSFISLGPAKKISEQSIFHPNIGLDYSAPDFEAIVGRIRSRRMKTKKKFLSVEKFSDLSAYEIAAVLHTIVRLCRVATLDDINYLFKAIFGNRFSLTKVQTLLSILVGSTHLQEVGSYGHFSSNPDKSPLATAREGCKTSESELRLSLADINQGGDPEFLQLIENAPDAN